VREPSFFERLLTIFGTGAAMIIALVREEVAEWSRNGRRGDSA